MQRVQSLQPDDYAPHIAFAQSYLGKCVTGPLFHIKMLFYDETSFTGEGIFNTHNPHLWAEKNPQAIGHRAAQTQYFINVWASITGDHFIRL